MCHVHHRSLPETGAEKKSSLAYFDTDRRQEAKGKEQQIADFMQ
jgi:hypothetical protein